MVGHIGGNGVRAVGIEVRFSICNGKLKGIVKKGRFERMSVHLTISSLDFQGFGLSSIRLSVLNMSLFFSRCLNWSLPDQTNEWKARSPMWCLRARNKNESLGSRRVGEKGSVQHVVFSE